MDAAIEDVMDNAMDGAMDDAMDDTVNPSIGDAMVLCQEPIVAYMAPIDNATA